MNIIAQQRRVRTLNREASAQRREIGLSFLPAVADSFSQRFSRNAGAPISSVRVPL